MAIYELLKTGLEGPEPEANDDSKRARTRFLPDNIHDGIRRFKSSRDAAELLGEEVHERFTEIKQASPDRCPKALGTLIKVPEIQFDNEVQDQCLWNQF